MAYQPIESYGVIGDMRTAALVGTNGSIDWLCFPHFDSPSVFAAILDDDKGGRFAISPTIEGFRTKQLYWPDSNVLVTRFLSETGIGGDPLQPPLRGQAGDEHPGHHDLPHGVHPSVRLRARQP